MRTLLISLWDPKPVRRLDRTIVVYSTGEDVGCEFRGFFSACYRGDWLRARLEGIHLWHCGAKVAGWNCSS
jgi:hypothetical protein